MHAVCNFSGYYWHRVRRSAENVILDKSDTEIIDYHETEIALTSACGDY